LKAGIERDDFSDIGNNHRYPNFKFHFGNLIDLNRKHSDNLNLTTTYSRLTLIAGLRSSNPSIMCYARRRYVFVCCACFADMSAVANLTLISTPLPPAVAVVAFPSFIPPTSWSSLPPAMSPEPPPPSLSSWLDDDRPFRSSQLRPRHHRIRSVSQSVSQLSKSLLSTDEMLVPMRFV